MSVTITLGWWIIPAALTVAWVAYGFMPTRHDDYDTKIVGVVRLLTALSAVQFSWIVYLVFAGVHP